MTFSDIEKRVASLDQREQKQLMGFLVSLELKRNQEWREEITRKLDDPKRWIPLEEVEKCFGID